MGERRGQSKPVEQLFQTTADLRLSLLHYLSQGVFRKEILFRHKVSGDDDG